MREENGIGGWGPRLPDSGVQPPRRLSRRAVEIGSGDGADWVGVWWLRTELALTAKPDAQT